MKCRSCAHELPAEARFCHRCGSPAAAGRAATEERKVVTILFCDLAGSSELSGLLDAELLRTIMLHYYALMREQVERHGGTVEKFIGDAVMAVFGLVTREDDARRALTAALAMMEAMAGFNTDLEHDHGLRLGIRIGIHTGEVVTTGDLASREALVSGEVVNIAARLQQAGAPGQILISAATRRAAGAGLRVADAGRLALKGISEPVEAVRLIAAPVPAPEVMRRFDTPFVGRDHDLSALDLAWGRVTAHGDAQLLTLLGEAGMGKTRLVTEWLRRHGSEIGVTGTGRCLPVEAGGSLMALAECVAPLVAGLASDPGRTGSAAGAAVRVLQGGLLLDGAPSPSTEETCAALESVRAAVAADRPVLLVIDDCHWAGPTLMQMLNRLMEDVDRLPVMLICCGRPELLDAFPGWGSGRANSTTVTISGLSADESVRLAASLVDVASHDHGVTERLIAQADGNPLYLEQLGAAVHERGASGDHLPPGLHALVAARIDSLDEAERMTLRYAAIVGTEFTADDVCCLAADRAEPAGYAAMLRGLARRRFIAPQRRPHGGITPYEFANVVTMRVAYEGLTKRARSELHERYAECLVLRQCSDVLVGEHFERAYRYHAEIGMLDERRVALRRRAAAHLARAGTFALRRLDLPRAQALLSRAAAVTDHGDPCLPEYLQQLGAACLTIGQLSEAEQALLRAIEEAGDHRLPAVAAHARLLLLGIRADTAAQEEAARTAVPIFTAAGDDLGLARSHFILARSCQRGGRHGRALAILDRALAHSVSAKADQELANTLGAMGMSLWHGPEPAPAAVARCERLLAQYGAERGAVRATLGFPLSVLCAIQGRSAQAREHLAAAHRAMASIAYADAPVFRPLLTGLVAAAQDEEQVADAALREALDEARARQAASLVRTVALELARLRLAQLRWREAAELVDGLPMDDDPANLASYLGIRARISALRGDAGATAPLADAAQAAARRTDSPIVQATAFLDRAHVAAALKRPGPAAAAAAAAGRRFAAKGDLSGVARAERLLAGRGHNDGRSDAADE